MYCTYNNSYIHILLTYLALLLSLTPPACLPYPILPYPTLLYLYLTLSYLTASHAATLPRGVLHLIFLFPTLSPNLSHVSCFTSHVSKLHVLIGSTFYLQSLHKYL